MNPDVLDFVQVIKYRVNEGVFNINFAVLTLRVKFYHNLCSLVKSWNSFVKVLFFIT